MKCKCKCCGNEFYGKGKAKGCSPKCNAKLTGNRIKKVRYEFE